MSKSFMSKRSANKFKASMMIRFHGDRREPIVDTCYVYPDKQFPGYYLAVSSTTHCVGMASTPEEAYIDLVVEIAANMRCQPRGTSLVLGIADNRICQSDVRIGGRTNDSAWKKAEGIKYIAPSLQDNLNQRAVRVYRYIAKHFPKEYGIRGGRLEVKSMAA